MNYWIKTESAPIGGKEGRKGEGEKGGREEGRKGGRKETFSNHHNKKLIQAESHRWTLKLMDGSLGGKKILSLKDRYFQLQKVKG